MKYKIPKNRQHQIRVIINLLATLWSKVWFKVLSFSIIVFLLFAIINFNSKDEEVTLTSPQDKNEQAESSDVKFDYDINVFELTHYLIAELSTYKDDNRVNSFSNIGLVINPEYVKSKKISPKIVAEKQKIVDEYIASFKAIAFTEEKKYGIPASITLAQGLLESDAGKSRLALNNNNHFGIKCFSKTCKKGHCVNYSDDSHKDFFINFKSPGQSYREHSLLLQKERYKNLYKLKITDHKNWAKGLQKAGYATDKKYASKLIKIIETLELHKLN